MALSTINRISTVIVPLSTRISPLNLFNKLPIKELLITRNRPISKVPARSFTSANRQYFQSKLSVSLWFGAVAATAGSIFLLRRRRGEFPAQVLAAEVFDYGSNVNNSKKSSPSDRSRHFNFIADVVEKAAPAVVYIEIKGRHPYAGVVMSNGSGFIVRSDGLIVTNAHVVANNSRVVVKLHDGRILDGVVRSVDPLADLAIIAVDATNLPTLQFGSSASLRPGEWVVAMGSPLSLSNTVTAGVVSSTHRGSRELGLHNKGNMEYIQTDASITVGNSGGPLVNLDGEVIGINTMKLDAGISFAIPSDVVMEFVRVSTEKIENRKGWFGSAGSQSSRHSSGRPVRRYMGITMLTLTPNIINELQHRQPGFPADVTGGVLVWKVIVGSPAHNGGLQPGDVVVNINGKEVGSAEDVYKAINEVSELRLSILRHSQRLMLTVVPQDSE